ncbi:hypothetical protein C8Q76DRAFT_765833 [Earliella scabrosa]|nr:hypothetical protein C8Q76DRAFT_765833 [Earliella scabrosa]
MNGSLSRGRQSVWAMLDNLRLKSLQSNASAGIAPDEKRTEAVLEDNDSIMFYIPLVPDEASAVELARSEIVSVDENGAVVEVLMENAPPPMPPMSATDMHTEAWKWHWPWKRPTPSPPPKPKTVEKRVWVPSTEKLSLQVMWWGYRLWLPPPVLAKLNDKQIEAAKLAAMVTTALQWLLNNVPEGALPPTLRPALMLVKSLVPYLGYIGGFVAWSWEGIKSFDVGFGVTLTATWLLPIALIPGTWEEKDVPKPAPPPSEPPVPTPDPPAGDPPEPPVNPTPPPSSDPSTPPTSPPTCPPAPAPAPEPAPPTSPTTDPLPPNGPSVI